MVKEPLIQKGIIDTSGNITVISKTTKIKCDVKSEQGLVLPSRFKVPERVVEDLSEKLIMNIPVRLSRGSKQVSLEGIKGSRINRSDYQGNGHWEFEEAMMKGKMIGFIYLIHNTTNDSYYIGKKQYKGTGKINKGKITNWSWYISSCDKLANDIKCLGKDNFKFIVLEEYATKGGLSFAETWSLCQVESPSRANWYNMLINKISWSSKERITDRHKERIKPYMVNDDLEIKL